jgi:pyocin large subunit-like protein
MPLLTNGFNTTADRFDHWDRHHADFEPPPCGEAQYEELADAFLAGPRRATTLECTRPSGRRCRYDPGTNEYGVLAADGCMVTYFKPNVAKHPHPTNEAYFHANC